MSEVKETTIHVAEPTTVVASTPSEATPAEYAARLEEAKRSWGPRVTERIEFLQEALRVLREKGVSVTAPMLCRILLAGDAKSVTKSVPRDAVLIFKDNKYFYNGLLPPMFADKVMIKLPSGQFEILGVIKSVRRLDQSAYWEITFTVPPSPTHDAILVSSTPIQLDMFALDMIPQQCAHATDLSDVIATFVQKDVDGTLFFKLMVFETDTNADLGNISTYEHGIAHSDSPAFVEGLAAAIKSEAEGADNCPGELINGQCVELQNQKTKITVAEVPTFLIYSQNLTQFEHELTTILANAALAAKLCAFFAVPSTSYATLRKRNSLLWTKLALDADDCIAQFIVTLHRNVFESYLSALNNLWQGPAVTGDNTKIAAIMWLLFYTQLPVFVTKLAKMMTLELTSKNIQYQMRALVREFHKELTKHVTAFLPPRDVTDLQQRTVIDNIRMYLNDIRIGVAERMDIAVRMNAPECFRKK